MTNPTPSEAPNYAEMLLDGMKEVREHLATWAHEDGAPDQRRLAAGYIVGMVTDGITSLQDDPARLELMNVIAPAMLAALRSAREGASGD